MMDMHRNIPVYGINKYLHHGMAFYSTRNGGKLMYFIKLINIKERKGETQFNELSLTVHVCLWLALPLACHIIYETVSLPAARYGFIVDFQVVLLSCSFKNI